MEREAIEGDSLLRALSDVLACGAGRYIYIYIYIWRLGWFPLRARVRVPIHMETAQQNQASKLETKDCQLSKVSGGPSLASCDHGAMKEKERRL